MDLKELKTLRDLTQEMHEYAETQPFAQDLINGNLTKKKYATYLYNQHPQYALLELFGKHHNLTEIEVAPRIYQDYLELWKEFEPEQAVLLPVVFDYLDHLISIKNDPQKLMAHIYVRHMGDLSGGQIISKKVPGSATMYKFDNLKQIKDRIRERCDYSMADEANTCFRFASILLEQMNEVPH